MFNIKNTLSFAAILCGLVIIFAAPQRASAQFLPPGSYQKSCKEMKTVGATLYATCRGEGTGYDFSASYDLRDFFECDGDIWNKDTKIKCNRNANSALMQKAKPAISAAYKDVFGIELGSTDAVYKRELRDLFEGGYAAEFYAGKLGPDGLFWGDRTAKTFYLGKLNSPKMTTQKGILIDMAFRDAYGTGVSPKDLAFYNAQKIGYHDVFGKEIVKIKNDKVLQRVAISYAYKKTFGRTSTPAETDYWVANSGYFQKIVDANRAFLYAPNGAKDLTETIKRHLLDKGIEKPSIEQINAKIIEFSKTKAIYDEMK